MSTTLKPSLCDALVNIEVEQVEPLLYAYTDAIVNDFDVADYWSYIPESSLQKFSVAQIDVMQGRFFVNHFGEAKLKSNYQVIASLASVLLKDVILCQPSSEAVIYDVIDSNRKIVRKAGTTNSKVYLARKISEAWTKSSGEILPTGIATKMAETWLLNSPHHSMPLPMARDHEDVWCLHRPTVVPNTEILFPDWQKILNRMSDGEAFAAWVGGIYSGLYKGRQILWLWGPHGEDGKSTIARILGNHLFGPAFQSISDATLKSEKRFLFSYFANAELICYPDANNRKVLSSEEFKMVANGGSDKVMIECKFQQPYYAELRARVWISSNHLPDVEDNNYTLSRLLLVKIDRLVGETPDPQVISRLEDQLAGFLAYALGCYRKKCPDNYKININDQTADLLRTCIASQSDYFSEIFDKYWECGTECDRLECSTVGQILRTENIITTKEIGKFYQWLSDKKGVVKRKISASGGKTFLFNIRRKSVVSITCELLGTTLTSKETK